MNLRHTEGGVCLLRGAVGSSQAAGAAVLVHSRPPDHRQDRRGGGRDPPLRRQVIQVRGTRPPQDERVKALTAAVAVGRRLE